MKKRPKVTGETATYERELEGVTSQMIEIEPGWFVAKEVWARLQRAGVDRCTKANEE